MKKRANSIRLRYTVIFALTLGAAIALSVFFNNIWLEQYYIMNKSQTMLTAYNQLEYLLNEADYSLPDDYLYNNPIISFEDFFTSPAEKKQNNEISSYMNSIQSESNITTLILSGDRMFTTMGADPNWQVKLYNEIRTGFSSGGNKREILKSSDNYKLIKTYDSSMDTSYLVCLGVFTDGSTFIMRTPLLGITESAEISNRFYIYVGIGALILGTILMYIVMGFITKPITSLTGLSKRMSELDFEAKYMGKSKDEIGELGQHMNEMSEKLEKTIAELKAANLELQHDIEVKNSIERERSEFVANVSHELKTPIALIQGYAEGLTDGVADDPESIAFYCDVISDEAEKMNLMVRRLLSLNQLEFGNEKLEMDRFDLTQLIKGVVDAQTIFARQKDAVIVFNQNAPMYIWADEFRIEEVITNFISNAVHHVSGKNIIEIKAIQLEGKCRIEVYNSGSHIPDEDLEKVWLKFYKVDKARTREYGGNGIGLSIVKAIADLHGGTCKAENTPDGVLFYIELPQT